MEHSDHVIDAYRALRPTGYMFLEDFRIWQVMPSETNDYNMCVDMQLRHQDDNDSRRLLLSFQGVRNIKLTPPAQMVIQMIHLEITSIRANGWERMNYSIHETENDSLFFLCETFTARVQSGAS
jgi:hypothetical protein